MNYILFDGTARNALLPFTFTRPVAEIRIGILTIREKWEKHLDATTSTLTEGYLSEKYSLVKAAENVYINASFLPNSELASQIKSLKNGQAVFYGEEVVAYCSAAARKAEELSIGEAIHFKEEALQVKNVWDIFSKNGEALQADFELLTKGRKSQPVPSTNNVIAPEHIFLEEGAKVQFCTLNATNGPIYIGKNSEIMEGSSIRGGFALCEGSIVKIGAKIYGPTTAGPYCKLGGEVNNSVLFGYSNKGHDGFLGNSVLGEWCNLGADTNTSNLKNNYDSVRLWNYETENFARTGLQFCGLIMGDHSKCGINTMFNTGTVIGVASNIYGSGFPRNFVPGFSWGGASGFTAHVTKKAFTTARIVMARRNIEFTGEDAAILEHVFEETKRWRKW